MSYSLKNWVLAILILVAVRAIGQPTTTSYKGRVVDAQTQASLAFTSVSVLNQPVGVITNSYGEFVFNIPSAYLHDTLAVSFIGYQTLKTPISALLSHHTNVLSLQPNSITLDEYVVRKKRKRPNVKGIIKKAIARIPRNYPAQAYRLEGYYRDYIKNDTAYLNLIEAALVVDDMGFEQDDYKTTRTKLEQIRVNHHFGFDSSQVMKYDNQGAKFIPFAHVSPLIGNEFSMLQIHNPVRNHAKCSSSMIDVLDKDFIPNHRFTLESVSWLDTVPIFKIRIKGSEYISSPDLNYVIGYLAEGYIYINTISFAIMKLDYTLSCTGRKNTYKIMDMKLEYREHQHKMYLNYFSFMNLYQTISDGELRSFNQYREFFVNKIGTRGYTPLRDEELMYRDSSLLKNNVTVNPVFWEHYNYVRTNTLLN